jgi:predicted O-methyltransferase YrrM
MMHLLGFCRATTQTTESERQTLANLARGKRLLAEIGVFQGVTARLLTSVMGPKGTYFAIDPYPVGRLGICFNYLIARNEVAKGRRGEVIWIKKTGADAPEDPLIRDKKFDFLFIDGDHSYEGLKSDWEAWHARIAPGGVVALHDTRGGRHACQRYMEEIILMNPAFSILTEVDSLTVLQRSTT